MPRQLLGSVTRESTVEDVAKLDFGKINPVTGPVYIDGAEPGDTLVVRIHEFKPCGFGWTANIPGFGLLADQFKDPALHIWTYDNTNPVVSAYAPFGKVPLKPFPGTIGVAPAAPGSHSIVPPRRVGGNLDIRDLNAGSTLYLPVEVAGALFSMGDTHAAQVDGEVCGTAIESQMNVVVEFDLLKGDNLQMPRFETAGPVTRHLDTMGYEVTTGVGPGLFKGAQDALCGMIDLLCARHNYSPVEAYMLCSACGDLCISEIVDAPNWVVSFYFPKVVLS